MQWTLHLFAHQHVDVIESSEIREDWPFGPELKRHRERAGLSQREASRRTTPPGTGKSAVSAGRWAQLETGWQVNKGARIPIGTTAATVAAAARAVQWDVDDALRVAGFRREHLPTPPPAPAIARYSDDELLDEIRQRMKGARHGVASEAQSDASAESDQGEEVDPGDRPGSPNDPKPDPLPGLDRWRDAAGEVEDGDDSADETG